MGRVESIASQLRVAWDEVMIGEGVRRESLAKAQWREERKDSKESRKQGTTATAEAAAILLASAASRLRVNIDSGGCYQGQTAGHEGFLLAPDQAGPLIKDKTSTSVIHPFLIGDEMIGAIGSQPSRYAIDLNGCEDIIAAKKHVMAYGYVEEHVLPDMKAKAQEEREQTKEANGPRQSHLKKWWWFWRGRLEMLDAIEKIPATSCAAV